MWIKRIPRSFLTVDKIYIYVLYLLYKFVPNAFSRNSNTKTKKPLTQTTLMISYFGRYGSTKVVQ